MRKAYYSLLRRLRRLEADGREWENDMVPGKRLHRKLAQPMPLNRCELLERALIQENREGHVSRKSARLHGQRLDISGWVHGSKISIAA